MITALLFAASWWKAFSLVVVGAGACALFAYLRPAYALQALAAAVVIIFGVSIYGLGRHHEAVYQRAKLQAQIERAVKTGRAAEAEALRKFDAAPDNYTDPFERKDGT